MSDQNDDERYAPPSAGQSGYGDEDAIPTLPLTPYTPPQYLPPPAPPANPPAYVQPVYSQPPYVQPAYGQPALGQPTAYGYAGSPYAPVRPNSGLAVASLICGIVGLFVSPFIIVFFVPVAVPIAAVIMGHIARSQIRRNPQLAGSGMALTGLILGYIPLVISALGLVMAIIGLALFGSLLTVPGTLS